MELSISHPSLTYGASHKVIAPRCKAFSSDMNKFIPIKSTAKITIKSSNFPSKFPTNLSRSSKSLLYDRHKRNSNKGSAQVESDGPDDSVPVKISRFGSVCYKFMRPYAMHYAIISAICWFARVLIENPQLFTWSLLFKAFFGLIAIILSRAYSVGINQIYDLDIDRVNKPYLPIPAGELSIKQAWMLVIFDLLVGLSILWLMNADLITTSLYCLGLFFATTYSAPPFRFKGSTATTVIVLPLMSAVIHNVGILYATRASLGLQFSWSPLYVFIITFVTLFYIVISITKDLTDIEGDRKHNVRTFAAIFGPKNIAFLGTAMLLVIYIGAMVVGFFMPQAFNCYLMLPAHAIFALWLLFQARKLDKENYSKEASANFYQCLWKLLMLEFLLFLFM